MQEALLAERRKLEEAISKEMKGKTAAALAWEGLGEASAAAVSSEAAAGGAEAGEEDGAEAGVDALDAFMSNVETQIEQDKVGFPPYCSHPLTCCATPVFYWAQGSCFEHVKHQLLMAGQEWGHPCFDSDLLQLPTKHLLILLLPAMGPPIFQSVTSSLVAGIIVLLPSLGVLCLANRQKGSCHRCCMKFSEIHDNLCWQVGALRREVAQIDKQVADAERLLKLADPDGYYREGTRAAEAAKAKGIKAMEVEKKRREAEERQSRERLVRWPFLQVLLQDYSTSSTLAWQQNLSKCTIQGKV